MLTSPSEPRLEGGQQVTFLFSTYDPRVVKHARRALNILDGRMVDGAAHWGALTVAALRKRAYNEA